MGKLDAGSVLAGGYGSYHINGTTDYADREFVALVAEVDCTFSNLEEAFKDGSTVSGNVSVLSATEQNIVVTTGTIKAGSILYPKRDMFSRVKLATGSMVAYRRD
jgi:hypothetical protein